MTQTGVFAFQEKAEETLEQKALRACEVIVSCGLGIRGGNITTGGNMVRARSAALSISEEELKALYDNIDKNPFNEGMVNIIGAMRNSSNVDMDIIAVGALQLKGKHTRYAFSKQDKAIFTAKPLNWDLNAAGEKRDTYREPQGLARELVDAFDIGYKNPALSRGRQIGDGSSLAL